MEQLSFFEFMNNILWGAPMIILLLGLHIYFSCKLNFVQRHIFKGIKLSFAPSNSDGVSAFATLSTTLAATLGTGNIIGISTAIFLGGPGAVFWCWITGVLGMATSYAECYLSLKYRQQTKNNTYYGGPMYVLEKGLNNHFFAVIFSLCTIMASFGVGCTTQANSIYNAIDTYVSLPTHFVGIVIALLCGLVIIGGISSISNLCMKLVPAMALFYLSGCIIILFINHSFIIESIKLIITSAFLPQSIISGITSGGFILACRYGVARGLFTNEAGLGSAPIAAAESSVDNIKEQSLISMTATFWDTVVMCAITGIAVVSTLLNPTINAKNISDMELVNLSFNLIPYVGNAFLSISIILFAFATLVGWSFFGEKAFAYIFGIKYINIYKIIYLVMIYIGTIISLNLVWEMCDFFNALMVIPNAIALIALRKEVSS